MAGASPNATARSSIPHVLVIVHGHEFATQRTPLFLRTALSSRTAPLSFNVLCDTAGCRGFREAWHAHVISEDLLLPGDELSIFEEDATEGSEADGPTILNERRIAPLPPRVKTFLGDIHPLCTLRGYDYLFLKVLAPELLPHADHIIVLDPDSIVLGDLAELWRVFDQFDESQLLTMAVDQSDRYYYRMQDERDEAHSVGWRGVPHSCGVNGGVLLLHAARARRLAFADAIATLTHLGVSERQAGKLDAFCDLAEQDTLNYAIIRMPSLWRPLHCSWNYMATGRGGHALSADPAGTPLTFYDTCTNGVLGAHGQSGDLLQCTCGRRIGLLHFAGGTRANPILARVNATVLATSGAALRNLASLRRRRPAVLPPPADPETADPQTADPQTTTNSDGDGAEAVHVVRSAVEAVSGTTSEDAT